MKLSFRSRSRYSYILLVFSLFFTVHATAQIGINTTDPKAMLDVTSSDSGILIPRVSLSRTTVAAPVVSPEESELVFNLATANDVTPGFYYWNGSIWVRLSAGGGSTGGDDDKWDLSGNSGTTPGDNFLGTKDNNALHIKTANTTRLIFPTENQIHANSFGSQAKPFYSFAEAEKTGMFLLSANTLGLSTDGVRRFLVENNRIVSIQNHQFMDGANGSPSITFFNNANMGLYRVNTDIMGFATSGTERMRISNSGVGINVSANPTERLQVNGNFRLDGALKPNNQAGNSGQVLLSTGNDQAPEWGADMATISRVYQAFTQPIDIEYGYSGIITLSDLPPNHSSDATVIITINGANANTNVAYDIKIHSIAVNSNNIEFGWSNTDPFDIATNYTNVTFNVTIIQ